MNHGTFTTLEATELHPKRRSRVFQLIFLLCLAGAVRLLWMTILPSGAISFDLLTWKGMALALVRHLNPYQITGLDTHPPAWMEIIYGLSLLSTQHGFDFIHSVRIVLITADLALLAAVYLLLNALQPAVKHMRLLVFGYCLNPLLILLTVQHGNFDSLSMIWVVLFLYFLVRFGNSSDAVDWLCAAGCLGIAVFVKQFPLVLWPLLASGARRLDWRCWLAGMALVIAPVALSLTPLYVLAPDAITQNVLEYRSLGNTFGVVGILSLVGLDNIRPVYSQLFTAAVFFGMIVVAIVLWRRPWRLNSGPVLFSTMLLLALFTIGPGYGSQYWFWVMPLILVCYANFDRRFRRVIWISMGIVVATNVFEYGIESNLGRYLYYLFPSTGLQSLGDFFPYPSTHLNLLRLPMTFASLGLLLYGTGILIRWQYQKTEPIDS